MESRADKVGEFFDAFMLFLEWCGKPNAAGSFTFLGWVDPQRIRKNTEKYLERLQEFAFEIVKREDLREAVGESKVNKGFLGRIARRRR
ncbi:UNVERIFIED_CONTAM: hypothetical protein Sangu_0108900 [Sesamum angustifolium]|uniref:Uncharacterized protein n=1 Tax=Sesamum angustifolium TaxID=2727405 RepID=A0AAW2RLW1_9LAMI